MQDSYVGYKQRQYEKDFEKNKHNDKKFVMFFFYQIAQINRTINSIFITNDGNKMNNR